MDVLELPRPVINFLRTISKEMNRYALCWDIYGGSESVTLTLTWKINCDESDDEQLAKSRRLHQQQLNALINMDLNSINLTTDNNSSSSRSSSISTTTTTNNNNTPILNNKLIKNNTTKLSTNTPSKQQQQQQQLQHSKLASQHSTSNNCLFSSNSSNNNNNNKSDTYLKKTTKTIQNQQQQQQQRNYSAESNPFSKFNEESRDSLLVNKQHNSRRPLTTNINHSSSLERNKNNYFDYNRPNRFENINNNNYDNDYDDDDDYDSYDNNRPYNTLASSNTNGNQAKKILKYTRGKSLENFDRSINKNNNFEFSSYNTNNMNQFNAEQHRYCQNCSNHSMNNNDFKNNNRLQSNQHRYISKVIYFLNLNSLRISFKF
jgi:hypothetical protein